MALYVFIAFCYIHLCKRFFGFENKTDISSMTQILTHLQYSFFAKIVMAFSVNYFRKKGPSWILDWVLNKSLLCVEKAILKTTIQRKDALTLTYLITTKTQNWYNNVYLFFNNYIGYLWKRKKKKKRKQKTDKEKLKKRKLSSPRLQRGIH